MSATLEDPMTTPFLQCLVGRIRAEDQFGAWDRKTDKDLLNDYLDNRRRNGARYRSSAILIPETLDRVEKFYQAIGLTSGTTFRDHRDADDENEPRGFRPRRSDRRKALWFSAKLCAMCTVSVLRICPRLPRRE